MLLDKVAEGERGAVGDSDTPAAPAEPPVPSDMGTLEITRGRQALELRSNLSERRALTDPIRPPGRDESSARNLQWAKAHGEGHGHPIQSWHLGRGWCRGGGQHLPSVPPWRRETTGTEPWGASCRWPRPGVTPMVTSPVGAALKLSTCRSQPPLSPQCCQRAGTSASTVASPSSWASLLSSPTS